ncbi:hypothetical protein M132_1700 [Bacteroides fragilis str. S24L15]|nr:hypothetical protein M132_1700 [Bacteroides fragilis str. S24L15]
MIFHRMDIEKIIIMKNLLIETNINYNKALGILDNVSRLY